MKSHCPSLFIIERLRMKTLKLEEPGEKIKHLSDFGVFSDVIYIFSFRDILLKYM